MKMMLLLFSQLSSFLYVMFDFIRSFSSSPPPLPCLVTTSGYCRIKEYAQQYAGIIPLISIMILDRRYDVRIVKQELRVAGLAAAVKTESSLRDDDTSEIHRKSYPRLNVKVLQEKQVITGSYRWLQVVEVPPALLRTS